MIKRMNIYDKLTVQSMLLIMTTKKVFGKGAILY